MGVHERWGVSRVVNAHGTYTPLGVSRTPAPVAAAVADALQEFFVIDQLADRAGEALAAATGADAGAVVHCTSAATTVAVAAAMAGSDPARIAALPDVTGMPHTVVVPAGHAVDYGQSNLQAIRLAGARVVLAGTEQRCDLADLDAALAAPGVACLLLVSSRLVRPGEPVDLAGAVRAAHARGVPAVVDAAAQFPRARELTALGADAVLISGQKYLASPTAGLVLGTREFVRAVRDQDRGIGRGMKPTKESLAGVLAALEAWRGEDWVAAEAAKAERFVRDASALPGITARPWPDPAGAPVTRAVLTLDDAPRVAEELAAGDPPVFVMTGGPGELVLELVSLTGDEIALILDRLAISTRRSVRRTSDLR
ncbi:beta-eliminating lyase-related protein [Amycolatopsis suaedae]|uniref:Aminotransferase class V-fold PLP-dependent enzyme n=1 Tax=Amycolatopsis suaedae TaxID=2510978 RepID=A0A4Q7JE79_9PSEU|nr:beta-eliminating lyase-related protein [Amycolatopsis suaedae]RZQ65789.1 aminotransferase class V-fold PLP-dependent enzyme [Amycolatopsis suaedae]